MPTTIISDNTTGRDFTGVEDTRIAGGAPNTNFGSSAVINVDAGSTGLIKFSGLSNISGPVTVSAANIQFCNSNGLNVADFTVTKLRRAWTEAGVTWNTYDGSNNWGTAGALNTSSDIFGSSSGSINYTSDASTTVYTTLTCTSGMLADLEDWINNPSNNHGWSITSPNGNEPRSSEATDGARPILTVTYTSSGGGGGKKLLTLGVG